MTSQEFFFYSISQSYLGRSVWIIRVSLTNKEEIFFPTHVIGLPLSIPLLGSLEFRYKYVFVSLLKFSYYILILFILASQLEES